MLWVLLFVGIALAGLAVLVVLGLRLWRGLTALLDELGTLADQAGELADLLAKVGAAPAGAEGHRDLTAEDGWATEVRT